MSNLAPQFVAAARAKNWKSAYDECNGCPMTAMLDGMQEIGADLLKDMRAQMSIFDVWGGPFMARIAWAMDVIQKGTVTVPQPQGVPDDQVREARTFLSKNRATAGTAASTRKVRIALFWTEAAKGEALSSRLVQKARELLKSNNTGLDLDVYQVHADLPYKGEISDSDDATKALDMANGRGFKVRISLHRLAVHADYHGSVLDDAEEEGQEAHGGTPCGTRMNCRDGEETVLYGWVSTFRG